MHFPQNLLDKVTFPENESQGYPYDTIANIINYQFRGILPFMSGEIIASLSYKFDPFHNKISRNFFFAFENHFLQKLISPSQSQIEATKNLINSKSQFDQSTLLTILRRLCLREVHGKLVFQKLATVIKEKRLLDKMTCGEIIQVLQYLGHIGKSARDLDMMRHVFRKLLPQFSSKI